MTTDPTLPAMTFTAALMAAAQAHEEQVDKAGWPYILHVLRVGLAGRTDAEKVVGFLHDVLEDGEFISARGLSRFGIPDALVETVEALTKRRGECYEDYLARVKADPLARAVKLNDLADNLREDRAAALSDAMIRRYTRAREYLLEETPDMLETAELDDPGPEVTGPPEAPPPLSVPVEMRKKVNLSAPFVELTLVHRGLYTGPTRGRVVHTDTRGFQFLTAKDGLHFVAWSNLAFWRYLPEAL